jgi:hypothetical protein
MKIRMEQNKMLIQSGKDTITGTSDWVYQIITFPRPYKTTPLISICQDDTGYATNWPLPMIKDISNTGFTYGWYKVTGTKSIIWQAIGNVD